MLDSLNGRVVGGCRVIQQLGKGGMSTIYLARQVSVGRDVAIKVLSPSLLSDETFMERFTREVETTAQLQHPRIIPIYDYGQYESLPYIVMAYIRGGTLDYLFKREPVNLSLTSHIVSQVAEALDFAHEQGVIHRDVKPSNILLDCSKNAILTDFGVARVISETQHLTRDSIVGTPFYIAPEMLNESSLLTSAVDIYALGVTIYQILTGTPPFVGQSTAQIMWAHVNAPVPLLVETRPDLPADLDVVLQKALAKLPASRYATAGELAADLAAVVAGRVPKTGQLVSGSARTERPLHALDFQDAVHRALNQVVKISRPDSSTGSGVYIAGDRVITCVHVVDGAPGLYVRFHTGEQIEADVIATDNCLDLALLQLRSTPTTLTAEQLDGIVFYDDPVEPGEDLVAIGHPLGLDWSVTGGHYNALRRPGEDPLPHFGIVLAASLVQVDVVINAGNSGGPIIDAAGHLIGIADSIINPALANNVGFAIACRTVLAFLQEHQDATEKLVAYNCAHHHAEGERYCPLTGKPIHRLDSVPMPTTDSVYYSCGHLHEPGLTYCPLTGKPVYEIDKARENRDSAVQTSAPSAVCTNCGASYSVAAEVCPKCGKPKRKV
ncbi:MAG: protein kinase [Anaerolineae bacterium]|nr:protein kinase [Anaerolineae bacterium]